MAMDVRIFSSAKVASEEERLDPLQERGIGCHHVDKLAVLRAGLAHHHLSVLFHDLGLDFARMLVHQRFESGFAADNGVANFFDATRTKTVGLAWEAERRRGAFVGFQQWSRGPFRADSLALRQPAVDGLKSFPGDVRKTGKQLRAFYSSELALI